MREARRLRDSSRTAGFSLIELVIVIVIVGVISAIAIPRYGQSIERYRVDAAAQRIVADLGYARSEARASSSPTTVSFVPAADAYTITGVAALTPGGGPYVVNLDGEPLRTVLASAVFDDPDDLADGLEEVTFSGFGQPDSGGTLVISSGASSRTITLDPETGKASIQ